MGKVDWDKPIEVDYNGNGTWVPAKLLTSNARAGAYDPMDARYAVMYNIGGKDHIAFHQSEPNAYLRNVQSKTYVAVYYGWNGVDHYAKCFGTQQEAEEHTNCHGRKLIKLFEVKLPN